jgi:hypothetical protein
MQCVMQLIASGNNVSLMLYVLRASWFLIRTYAAPSALSLVSGPSHTSENRRIRKRSTACCESPFVLHVLHKQDSLLSTLCPYGIGGAVVSEVAPLPRLSPITLQRELRRRRMEGTRSDGMALGYTGGKVANLSHHSTCTIDVAAPVASHEEQWLTRKEIPGSDAVCEKEHLVLTEFILYCSARMALPHHDLHPCPRHRYIRSTKSKQ